MPEVVVVLAIVGIVALFLLMALPRQRETARLTGCRKNLMQIGFALALYDQQTGYLPLVSEPLEGSPGPLRSLLEALDLPDVTRLRDAKHRPDGIPSTESVVTERPVPGFICASDPNATAGHFPAPVSYRAATGDAPDARNGAFAPGRRVRLADIEASDGTSYTAAFAERLVGNSQSTRPALANYALAPSPLKAAECPPAPDSAWRGDAGSSWFAADWRSSLYNHALTPNASPSCIAADGQSALMGASSGHVPGVNVLFCDGSVKTVSPGVDARIWRGWAAFTLGPPTDAQP